VATGVGPRTSGERLFAVYRLRGDEAGARALAEAIAVEQTVEFPRQLLPGGIEENVVGRVEALERDGPDAWRCTVAYPVEDTGWELPQLLNVVWGNVSLMPGVRLVDLVPSPSLYARLSGPRFGREGLRQRLGVPERPLLCTALKPMGLTARELAAHARDFALGGIDLIKDDHGLANQPFAPWRERVARCAEAVEKANAESGRRALYLPNATAPADELLERAHAARALGAGGLLVSPGLTGLDAMRALAADDSLDLPIIAHPAFLGTYALGEGQGIAFDVLFGTLMRLAGADVVIFPNYGGRFSLRPEQCRQIVAGTGRPLGPLRPAFPSPGGGMRLERIPDMLADYGRDVVLLIGGGLFALGAGVREGSERFLAAVSGAGSGAWEAEGPSGS
jgi:ribulose-bisphosphate carboxylase large chain